MNRDTTYTIIGVTSGVVLVLLVIFGICARNLRKRRLKRKGQTIYVVPVEELNPPDRHVDLVRSAPPPVADTNRRNFGYLVPFSALPADFDYTSPNVKVKDGHVVISDLTILGGSGQNVSTNVPSEVVKQAPYNPYYNYMS